MAVQSIPEPFRKNFTKNLTHLKSIEPSLYKKIAGRKIKHRFEPTMEGSLTLNLNGLYVESRYRPRENAPRFLPHGIDEKAYIIFLGSGLGYHINAALKDKVKRGVLIEENPEIFCASLFVLEPELLCRITLIVASSEECVREKLSALTFGGPTVVRHAGSVQFNLPYYRAIEEMIKSLEQTRRASYITGKASRKLWLRNVLLNLSAIHDRCFGTKALEGQFGGPAILVASGPFLESIIHRMVDWCRAIPVIALLPSVPYLFMHGIAPDFILTTDASFWNRYRLVKGLSLPLITTFSVDRLIFKNWAGDVHLFSHDLAVENLFNEVRAKCFSLPMQGTASIVSILLARRLGFSPLYLAGFDFACNGIKDHHSGAGFDEIFLASSMRLRNWHTAVFRRMRNERLIGTRDLHGNCIVTTCKLDLYRNWLENELHHTDLARLNNGAVIGGLRQASADELDRYDRGLKRGFLRRLNHAKRLKIEKKGVGDDLRALASYAAPGAWELPVSIFELFYGQPGEDDNKPARAEDMRHAFRYLQRCVDGVEQ